MAPCLSNHNEMITPKRDEGPQLVAELSVFSAADALQWAESSRLTGRLSFRADQARITLLFEHGGLIYAESRDRRAAFGRHLFSEGLVDEVDLAAAMVYGRDNQQRIGAVMVELGILTASLIKTELHRHTLNLASQPLSWAAGWVSAERSDSEIMPVVMPEPVDPTYLLMESARRVDETVALRRVLPHDNLTLNPGAVEASHQVSPRARRVLETLTPNITLAELFESIGGCHFLYLESIASLVELGGLEVGATYGGLVTSQPLSQVS